jgi:hypothetical protein
MITIIEIVTKLTGNYRYFMKKSKTLLAHVSLQFLFPSLCNNFSWILNLTCIFKTKLTLFLCFRKVCTWMNNVNQPDKIGGPGVVVQIDESVISKRRNHQGRIIKPRWVFGGYCPQTKKGFFVKVRNRSAATLLPLIMVSVILLFFPYILNSQ